MSVIKKLEEYLDLTGYVPTQLRRLLFGGTDGSKQFSVNYFRSSTVNYIQAQGGITGEGPALAVQGSDTNSDFNFAAKGTGGTWFGNGYGPLFAAVDAGASAQTVNWLQFKPSIAGSSPSLSAAGADANLDLQLNAKGTGNVVTNGPIQLPVYTVATLPAASANQYARAFVSDATATTFNSAVVGGGGNKVPVWSNGASWLIG